MQLVRGSEVQSFLRCRQQWRWRWVDKIRPKKQDGKLFFGTLMHKFLEVYYDDPSGSQNSHTAHGIALGTVGQLFEETDKSRMEQTEIDELWEMLEAVTWNYKEQWQEQDRNFRTIATELTFAIPLTNELAYTGTIDWIGLDQDGRLWFRDYKTVASISRYVDAAAMDRQISRYWWALQQLVRGNGYVWHGEQWVNIKEWDFNWLTDEPHGFIYDLIKKDVPHPPEMLKKGGLSKNKAQKTTYKMYFDALKQAGLAEDYGGHYPEYDEILAHLAAQETPEGNRYFRRMKVNRTQAEVDRAMIEFDWTVRDMYAIQQFGVEDRAIYRNVTYECPSMCSYYGLCQASLDGSNVDMLINLAYEKIEDEERELDGD